LAGDYKNGTAMGTLVYAAERPACRKDWSKGGEKKKSRVR